MPSANASTPSQLSVGDLVFFRHPKHSWILGNVVTVDGQVTCRSDDPKRSCVGELVPKLKPEADVTAAMSNLVDEDVADLLHLTVLHESTLLRCLYLRYISDVIYTNVGAIVVALNPFSFSIPHYQDSCMQDYLAALAEGSAALLPHTWATAHVTYYELLASFSPQFILVSGESGSGKTEASKIVVKYLSALSSGKGSPAEDEQSKQCGAKMQRCSPILESFGNAKTVRNDNSSRFGKFMKIQFTASGVLCGSFTERYLLEKSRIVSAGEGERVYHSFYLMLRGVGKRLGIAMKPEGHYKSINSGGVLRNEDYDSEADSDDVIASMRTVGLDAAAIQSAWKVTAGILHLLNLRFEQDESGTGAVLSSGSSEDAYAAAGHWDIAADELATELLQTALIIRNEVSCKRHSPVVAADCRDAVCKALYDKLFDWLVTQCNRLCDAPNPSAVAGWVGLLDIFGFEDFKLNSFEQLCINLANESLQGHYNLFVFDKDMEECKAEGINTVNIACPNNRPCLDLVQDTKKGILSLLDDQSSMATGTNEQFVESCVAMHGDGKSADFVVEKTKRLCFSIRHYAGTVCYDCTNWVEKNRDTLKDGMRMLLRSSKDPVIASLLDAPADPSGGGGRGKRAFVSTFFRQQLSELMAIINASNPHWIRCVKPHPAKKPRMFDGVQAMAQLESSGVLGTVKIRKAGYPVRILYAKFVERFLIMAPSFLSAPPSKKDRDALLASLDRCRKVTAEIVKVMGMLDMEVSQLGKTKLFMKADALTKMEHLRRQCIATHTFRVKLVGRGYLARKQQGLLRIEAAVKRIVFEYRDYCSRCAADRAARAARQAAMVKAVIDGAADLVSAFINAVTTDWLNMSPPRIERIEAHLLFMEERLRANILADASTTWASMIGAVAYDFLVAQEEIKRYVLTHSSEMAQQRWYLILYAYDTLMDDWMEEEEYQRLRLEEEAMRELDPAFNRPLFGAMRTAVCIEAVAAHDALVRQWAQTANECIVRPRFGEAVALLLHGGGGNGDSDARRSCEGIRRRFIEVEEERHRSAIRDGRFKHLLFCKSRAVAAMEEAERHSLILIEAKHWCEMGHNMTGMSSSTTARELWELFIREMRRCVGEEQHARKCLVHLHVEALNRIDVLDLSRLETAVRRSIEKKHQRATAHLVHGTLECPHPRTFGMWVQLWSKEQHWRNAMMLLEVKHRHLIQRDFLTVRELWQREHWLRRMLFLMRCLQISELSKRFALMSDQCMWFRDARRQAWHAGVQMQTEVREQRRFETDAQKLLYDNLRLSDLESMLHASPTSKNVVK